MYELYIFQNGQKGRRQDLKDVHWIYTMIVKLIITNGEVLWSRTA